MSNLAQLTAESLALMKNATTTGLTVSTGLQYYDLEEQAKRLYPVLTPLRNKTARVTKPNGYGTQPHWKVISNVNASAFNGGGASSIFIGVSEGNRNAAMPTSEVDYTAPYKGIGLENSVTFEADYAGRGFDDLRSLAQMTLLEAVMIGEENMMLNGNTSLQLGTTPTPTGTVAGSGSAFTTGTAFFFVVALTPLGVQFAGGLATPTTAALSQAVLGSFNRPNVDASSDTINGGSAAISAQGSVGITSGQNLTATVAGVKGAAGYAWFVGQTTGAANCKLAAITSIPTAIFAGVGNAGNQAANYTGSGTDNSTNALSFDGYTTIALTGQGSTPGYYTSLAGATLTSDGHGGVAEIETALKYQWDNFRLSSDEIHVGSKVLREIRNLVLGGTSNPVYNVILAGGEGQKEITAGSAVGQYLNIYVMDGPKALKIILHPFMPDGWIFFNLTHVPYPNANVPAVARVVTRQEYYSKEWPVVTRKYPYGVYADEVLQHYIPFGLGLIQDVG